MPTNQPRDLDEVADAVRGFQREMAALLPESLRSNMLSVVEFRQTLTVESDRGCALMAAAFLDGQLVRLIETVLVDDQKLLKEMFGPAGPLGTFSSRINMAYLLGLLPSDARKSLHLLRRIRNDFAHEPTRLTFDHGPISDHCRQISFHMLDESARPRHIFTNSMMGILATIHSRTANISKDEPSSKPETKVDTKALGDALKRANLPSDLQTAIEQAWGLWSRQEYK